MKVVLEHIRRNVVGYIALFVALGGTGYAAATIPQGSVGSRQIKNHAIDPIKLNPKFINGNVRAWAVVTFERAGGWPVAGSRRGRRPLHPACTQISWGVRLKPNCGTIATIDFGAFAADREHPDPGRFVGSVHGGVCRRRNLQRRSWPPQQRDDRCTRSTRPGS